MRRKCIRPDSAKILCRLVCRSVGSQS